MQFDPKMTEKRSQGRLQAAGYWPRHTSSVQRDYGQKRDMSLQKVDMSHDRHDLCQEDAKGHENASDTTIVSEGTVRLTET